MLCTNTDPMYVWDVSTHDDSTSTKVSTYSALLFLGTRAYEERVYHMFMTVKKTGEVLVFDYLLNTPSARSKILIML